MDWNIEGQSRPLLTEPCSPHQAQTASTGMEQVRLGAFTDTFWPLNTEKCNPLTTKTIAHSLTKDP